MNIELLRTICTSFPNVTEDIKWENHLCFCVEGKMFLIAGMDESPVTASFKASEELFEELSNRAGMKPAPYLARYKWIFIDDISRLEKKEWEKLAGEAYAIISSKLPKTKTASAKKAKHTVKKKQAVKKKPAKKAVKKSTGKAKPKKLSAGKKRK